MPLNDMPNALEDLLSSIIAEERREWDRQHELALAQRDVLIADQRRELTELHFEFKQKLNDIVFWAETAVAKAIENVRDGKDGKDGEPGKVGDPGKDAEPLSDEQISLVLASNTKLIIKAVEDYFAANPLPEPERGIAGEPGKDGADGADADPAVIETMVAAAVAKIPPAKDGKDADPEEIKEIIQAEIAKAVAEIEIPVPKDGEPGKDGKDGIDGKSVDEEEIKEFVKIVVEEAVSAIPVPKDGVAGEDGKDGLDGHTPTVEEIYPIIEEIALNAVAAIPKAKDGENGKDGKDGNNGKDGVDGKDGADVVSGFIDRDGNAILTLENGRTINLGCVVGMDGKDGAPGLGFQDSDFEFDGERRVTFKVSRNGTTIAKQFVVPAMIYQGVYEEGKEYERGDCVTWSGSLHHCNEATKEKPGGGNKAWTLAVKRGADGRDAKIVKE